MSKFCQTETLPISFNQKKSISLALRQHQISLTQRNLMHIKREEVETEHWISTLTYGHPHIMYLTYFEGEPWVVVIKKTMPQSKHKQHQHHSQHQKNTNEMWRIRMSWDPAVHDETIIEGELIRTNLGAWLFIARDLYMLNNKLIKKQPFLTRMQQLVTLSDSYKPYPEFDPFQYQILKIIPYPKFKSFLHEFIPALPYPCKGLYFHGIHKNYDTIYLFPDRETIRQANIVNYQYLDQPYPTSITFQSPDDPLLIDKTEESGGSGEGEGLGKSFTLEPSDIPDTYQKSWIQEVFTRLDEKLEIIALLQKTEQAEIYPLSLQTESIGYAHIPTLKMSRKIRAAFNENSNINVKCVYNTEFQKWQPLSIVTDKTSTPETIDSYQKLTTCLLSLSSNT